MADAFARLKISEVGSASRMLLMAGVGRSLFSKQEASQRVGIRWTKFQLSEYTILTMKVISFAACPSGIGRNTFVSGAAKKTWW
jgi:hypothetical protein